MTTKRNLKDVRTNDATDLANPQNRIEHFLANIARLVNTLPDGEYSRLERYLKYIAENGGGGGDVTVVPLVVSENGEYSEPGKAYAPVVVQVPTTGSVPTGQIITMMATVAPTGYLACDGTVYNIADYVSLAAHFETNFGTPNHFGGDGVTTFAVPDLRGEFLRGTGTNSHANQGSGATVGVHQDGTLMPNLGGNNGYNSLYEIYIFTDIFNSGFATENADFSFGTVDARNGYSIICRADYHNSNEPYGRITTRPTNTSVLYCIKT